MNPRHQFATAALLAAVLVDPGVAPNVTPAPAMNPGSLTAPSARMTMLLPTDVPSPRTITISTPSAAAAITSPVLVTGATTFYPAEATLLGQVRDADGTLLGEAPLTVHSPDIGQPGPFDGVITFTPPWRTQDGTLDVIEVSPKDGSIVTIQRTPVRLTASWPWWATFPLEASSAGTE
jgi:hypothetical protein